MISIKTEIILNAKKSGGYWAGVSVKHTPIKPLCDTNALDWAGLNHGEVEGQVYVFHEDMFMLKAQFVGHIQDNIALNICKLLQLPNCNAASIKALIKKDCVVLDNNKPSYFEPKKDEWIVW